MNYPKNLIGTYLCDFSNLTLKPIYIPNMNPNDFMIRQIWFEDGISKVIFEDGYIESMEVRYSKEENSYLLNYHGIRHVFQIKASLQGLDKHVEMKLSIDLAEMAKGNF
jgi:hypothetical protein